jgi:hypothetical protein
MYAINACEVKSKRGDIILTNSATLWWHGRVAVLVLILEGLRTGDLIHFQYILPLNDLPPLVIVMFGVNLGKRWVWACRSESPGGLKIWEPPDNV